MADTAHNGHGGHNGHANGHTNGHAGHGGVRFERTDVDVGTLYAFGMILTLVVVVAAMSMWFLYGYLNTETKEQNKNLSTLIKEAARTAKPGDRLPNNDGLNGPILEGIEGLDPAAYRSGVPGYPTLSAALKKKAAERLNSYGYLDKDHKIAHLPVAVVIDQMKDKLAVREKGKGPDSPIGAVSNPYSFWPSDSSAGRKPAGGTEP